MSEDLIMRAYDYDNQDVTDWWLSEKFDGVMAIWDGNHLISRCGNKFFAPDWFTEKFPKDFPLNGELWIGRGQFQKVVSVVKKKFPIDSEWEQVKFIIFDTPDVISPFEHRLLLCGSVSKQSKYLGFARQIQCSDICLFEHEYQSILAKGGEGVMLHRPGSLYTYGKSKDVIKRKPKAYDEADVIGYIPGKGKNTGKTGALICTWNNKTFRLGSGLTDEQRNNPPAIGAKVTFKRNGLTAGGFPRHPVFIEVRDYE